MSDNPERNEQELRKQLIALLQVFEGKPHLLASYLLHFDVFKKDFKNKLTDNAFLKDVSDDLKESGILIKPYFTTIESMQEYYNNAFQQAKQQKSNHSQVLKAANDEQALLVQLMCAVDEQEFEKAVRIKQYMEELGYNSSIF